VVYHCGLWFWLTFGKGRGGSCFTDKFVCGGIRRTIVYRCSRRSCSVVAWQPYTCGPLVLWVCMCEPEYCNGLLFPLA
jgi:hypothetical protein